MDEASVRPAFLRAHPFPSLVVLASLTISACTIHLPQSVLDVEYKRDVVAEQPAGSPYLHLVPHPDGLGWTVYPRQPVRQEVATTTTEQWHAWTQQHRSWNQLENGIAVPLCPITVVLGYATASLKPSDQAFELPFKTCSAILGYRWSEKTIDYPVIDPSTPQIAHADRPITSGTLTLLVTHPDGTSQSLERQVTSSTSQSGIPMRLRWVTHATSNATTSDDIWKTLSASLLLTSEERVLIRHPLSVSPDQWQQAYAGPILEANTKAWPTSPRVHWTLVSSPDEFSPELSRFTKLAIEEGLANHHVVVITKESRQASVNQLLAQTVDGRFDETRIARPGQWRGANVLLLGEMRTPVSGTHQLWLTLINMGTGIVLTKLTYEAPTDSWKELVHAATGDVLDVLKSHNHQ